MYFLDSLISVDVARVSDKGLCIFDEAPNTHMAACMSFLIFILPNL